MQKFQSSCKVNFFSRWAWEYLCNSFPIKQHQLKIIAGAGAVAVAAIAVLHSIGQILGKKNIQM